MSRLLGLRGWRQKQRTEGEDTLSGRAYKALVAGAIPSIFPFLPPPGSAKKSRLPPREQPAPCVQDVACVPDVTALTDDQDSTLNSTMVTQPFMEFQSAEKPKPAINFLICGGFLSGATG